MLLAGATTFVAEAVVEQDDHGHDGMVIERLEPPQVINPARSVATERTAMDDLDDVNKKPRSKASRRGFVKIQHATNMCISS